MPNNSGGTPDDATAIQNSTTWHQDCSSDFATQQRYGIMVNVEISSTIFDVW